MSGPHSVAELQALNAIPRIARELGRIADALDRLAEEGAGHVPSRVPPKEPEWMTVTEVADLTRIKPGTLRYWRHQGDQGPPSVRRGRRVFYRRADVIEWMATSSEGTA